MNRNFPKDGLAIFFYYGRLAAFEETRPTRLRPDGEPYPSQVPYMESRAILHLDMWLRELALRR